MAKSKSKSDLKVKETPSTSNGSLGLFPVTSVDESLDLLFQSSVGPANGRRTKDTKLEPVASKEVAADSEEGENASDASGDLEDEEESQGEDDGDDNETSDVDLDALDDESDEEILDALRDLKKDASKRKRDGDDDELEDRYMEKLAADTEETAAPDSNGDSEEEDIEGQDSDDSDDNDSPSVTVQTKTIPKVVLPENELEKAERTVFVGNLSNAVISEKPKYKQLKSLFGKSGTIESIRFRSVAFSEMLPRKAAFIKQKLHKSRQTVNAYIVFAKKSEVAGSLELNGTIFLDHHLRVDSVAHPGKQDNKRSVFVGNLDFEADEEPLWKHFTNCGSIEYVRLIRDPKTNVGKGFGYVQFQDSNAIGKALLLDGKKTEGPGGRKLRVMRAKTIRSVGAQPTNTNSNNNKRVKLSSADKTKVGRALNVLGRADRSQITKGLEGQRATPGDTVPGFKSGGAGGGKRKGKPRTRAPRITARSKSYKAKSASK